MRIFSKTSRAFCIVLAVAMLVLSTFAFVACDYCAHDTEVIWKVPSTCVEHGTGYAYKCKKCGKLFGYTEEDGLFEITEPEVLPLGGHTLSDNLSVRLKDGKTQAESIWDYEVMYKCAIDGCNEYLPVPKEHLATIVPPNIPAREQGGTGPRYNGTYAYNDEGIPYTQIRFASATPPTNIVINPTKYAKPKTGNQDKTVTYDEKYEWVDAYGSYQRFPLYVPFNAGETRQVFYFIKNTTDTTEDPITIEWCIDGNTWSEPVTIAPGEIKPLIVTGKLSDTSNLVVTHIRVKNGDNDKLGKVMNIEMTGVFFISGEVAKLDIDKMPDKVEYAEGEKFDPTGLKIYATYTDYCLGKTLRIEDCTFSCGDRPLTKADDKITVSYGGKKVSFAITVS